jgi:hypothetical protein
MLLCLKVVSCEKIADSDFSSLAFACLVSFRIFRVVPGSLQLFFGYNTDKT